MTAHSGSSRRSDTDPGTGQRQPCVISVLIAHRDPLIAAGLAAVLRNRPDFKAVVCSPATTSQGAATHGSLADVVVADYDDGLRLIEPEGAGSPRVMILTHSTSEAKICRALEQGVRGYVLLSKACVGTIFSARLFSALPKGSLQSWSGCATRCGRRAQTARSRRKNKIRPVQSAHPVCSARPALHPRRAV